jgi:hypothetical protein
MLRIGALAIGFLFLVGSVQSAPAETLRNFKVANWSAGAYSFKGTRRFSHCAASAPYLSGVALFFSVNREYQWSVAFSAPHFNVVPGQSIKLGLSVDGNTPTMVVANAVSDKLISVDLAPTAEIFNLFRRGNILHLIAKDISYKFSLKDTSRMLPALLQCVHSSLNPAPIQSTSTVAATATAPRHVGATATKDYRAEATALIANLLSHAGIQGFQIAPAGADEIGTKAEVVWSAPKMSGALFIMENADIKKPSDATPALVSMGAKACKGAFFSGALPEESDEQFARVFTSCRGATHTKTFYFITTPRSRGGHYVFLTSVEAGHLEVPKGDADASIRAAVLKVLPR